MNAMDRNSLRLAREGEAYARSAQAAHDRTIDIVRRAKLDRALGHTPECGLTKCAAHCPSMRDLLA